MLGQYLTSHNHSDASASLRITLDYASVRILPQHIMSISTEQSSIAEFTPSSNVIAVLFQPIS
jgi:hypothetical protein